MPGSLGSFEERGRRIRVNSRSCDHKTRKGLWAKDNRQSLDSQKHKEIASKRKTPSKIELGFWTPNLKDIFLWLSVTTFLVICFRIHRKWKQISLRTPLSMDMNILFHETKAYMDILFENVLLRGQKRSVAANRLPEHKLSWWLSVWGDFP